MEVVGTASSHCEHDEHDPPGSGLICWTFDLGGEDMGDRSAAARRCPGNVLVLAGTGQRGHASRRHASRAARGVITRPSRRKHICARWRRVSRAEIWLNRMLVGEIG